MSDSRLLSDLRPALAAKAQRLLTLYRRDPRADRSELLITSTLRDLDEQARLWRQSRTYRQIADAVEELRADGYGLLAQVLVAVGDRGDAGARVTDALPGFSFHQWGLAFDVVPLLGGVAAWGRLDLFDVSGELGEGLGPEWG